MSDTQRAVRLLSLASDARGMIEHLSRQEFSDSRAWELAESALRDVCGGSLRDVTGAGSPTAQELMDAARELRAQPAKEGA